MYIYLYLCEECWQHNFVVLASSKFSVHDLHYGYSSTNFSTSWQPRDATDFYDSQQGHRYRWWDSGVNWSYSAARVLDVTHLRESFWHLGVLATSVSSGGPIIFGASDGDTSSCTWPSARGTQPLPEGIILLLSTVAVEPPQHDVWILMLNFDW